MTYQLITTQSELNQLSHTIQTADIIAIDLEANSLYAYHEKICLIQLAIHSHIYIIDPQANINTCALLRQLLDKKLIFHSPDFDLRLIWKEYKIRPNQPLFDTQLAAQLCGIKKFSLANIVHQFFGIQLCKKGQKENWGKRPLKQELLTYAANDTRYLIPLYEILSGQLNELNRMKWHDSLCNQLIEHIENQIITENSDIWRLQGSGRFSQKELAYLKSLYFWRNHEAQIKNRPLFHICRNAALLKLSQHLANQNDTSAFILNSSLHHLHADQIERLYNAINSVNDLSPDEYPEIIRSLHKKRISDGYKKKLKNAITQKSLELNIPSYLLASRAQISAINQCRAKSIQHLIDICHLLPWQADIIAPLIKCIDNLVIEK